MNPPHRWLITGGCGFIGTNPIDRIIDQKTYHIRVIDNLFVRTKETLGAVTVFKKLTPGQISGGEIGSENPDSNIELIVGDIIDPQLALYHRRCRRYQKRS